MTREEYIKAKIAEKGLTVKGFASQIDIPYSTLASMLKPNKIGGAALDNVLKICSGLNITVNDLQTTGSESGKIHLTEQEKMMVYAYRSNSKMQDAVDTLLGIQTNSSEIVSDERKKNA